MAVVDLLISSGNGPAECRIALSRLVEILNDEAVKIGCLIEVTSGFTPDKLGPRSALVHLEGQHAEEIARSYCGTIRFIFRSSVRPGHKRQNWFVSVCRVEKPETGLVTIAPSDVRFETLRAGGPGGQHQNTTDSAVRVVHIPTGLQVVARNERSQHRNKAQAMERLTLVLQHLQNEQIRGSRAEQHRASLNIERGNEVKTFRL